MLMIKLNYRKKLTQNPSLTLAFLQYEKEDKIEGNA